MRTEETDPDALGRKLIWPLRLTRAGLAAERLTRAFWPVWTLAFVTIAALAFGFQDWAPLELFWAALIIAPLALGWGLWRGFRAFRWPSPAEAMARLDETLPGRPLAALSDHQALGTADPASRAVWAAHRSRMAAAARLARAPAPDLRLNRRDPYALRYAGLTLFLVALMFGSLWRVGGVLKPALPATGPVVAASWEGWVEPPAYTGRPTIYLATVKGDTLDLPQGSRIILRLYGPADALSVTEDVAEPVAAKAPAKAADNATQRVFEFIATRSGRLAIEGEGGHGWQVNVRSDAPPTVALGGAMDRKADGHMSQPFRAADDFGIVRGEVRFTLDLAAIDRRFGLAPDPDTRPPLVFDLPMPMSGSRAAISDVLSEDASEHAWANLPVTMVMTVTDGLGQTGSTAPVSLTLPGRRFFDPLAGAIIEMRRDIMWSRANAERADQILRAVTNRPEGFVTNERAYLMLRVAIRRLSAGRAQGLLAPSLRAELVQALWDAAVLIEDGGLDDALARMQRAQDRLSEAMKNGASPDEIRKLMDELRDATDDYMQMLADRQEADPADRFTKNQPSQKITGDQIQGMMDEIQRLMEQGRMAEAQQLLEQLNQLMQNLKVTRGEGGEGQDGPKGQAMRDLQKTLRDQQDLSDDSFRRGQEPGQSGQGSDGTEPLPDPSGRDGQGAEGRRPSDSLADRQRALRQELDRQAGRLPDAQGQDADNARRSLEDAGRAMEGAEQALRDGDRREAIDRQAEAIRNLREGMRSLGEAFAQDQNRLDGQNGQAEGDPKREVPRDPLGRQDGMQGLAGEGRDLLDGKDIYGRARALLDEIRRRSSEQTRPTPERDYLRRLLEEF